MDSFCCTFLLTANPDPRPNVAIGIVVTLLFFGLVALFCLLLIRLYRRRTAEYYREKMESQRRMAEVTFESQRQLMAILARDFHDDIGQQLTVMNFGIERFRLDTPENEPIWSELSSLLSRASDSVRMLSHTLGSLADQDLVEAIRTECDRIESYSGMTVHFTASDHDHWEETEKVVLYRIFQECVNNALKHANARNLYISLQRKPVVTFSFRDNGSGFDIIQKKENSFGLESMRTRAKRSGFSLSVESAIGNGTLIKVIKDEERDE